MQFDYRRLRGRIIEKFSSQREFAKKAGYSERSLSYKLNGKTDISHKDIYKWIGKDYLDIPNTEVGEYFFSIKS